MNRCEKCRRVYSAGRKLCQKCAKEGRAAMNDHDPDLTEAQLDAIIAEQRKCLPAWWNDSTSRRKESKRNAAIREARKQGKTIAELASAHGLTAEKVYKIIAAPKNLERQRRRRAEA